jgi:diguanylate cyclase (GGDEF)-like protein/PAS domain S-box-containing protein
MMEPKTELKLLIVDDTPMNLVLLEQLLKDSGCDIRLAQGGPEALELVEKNDFSVILLDIQMPEMDGYETAKAIKRIPRARHTPIIFITSIFQDEKSVKLGYEAGAVDYLFRPVDPMMLRAKVKVFTDLHRQRMRLEHEISQRTRMAEALSKAEERYRSFFEKAVEGIFQTSLDGTFRDVNPAMVRLLGYNCPDELLGKPGLMAELILDDAEREAYLAALESEGYVSNWEFRLRRKDGKVVWISESSRLVTSEEESYIEGVVEDVTERKLCEEDLQRQATIDSLTDIPNRTLFFDRLEHAVASSRRYDEKLAVLFIDLNDFKKVNDSHGHGVGDTLLRQVAGRFRERVRASDTLARLGGDEFGVILPVVEGRPAVAKVAEGLLAALEEPFHVDGHEVMVGATIGISLYPEHAEAAAELVRMADMAMYAAKRGGKSPYAFHGC